MVDASAKKPRASAAKKRVVKKGGGVSEEILEKLDEVISKVKDYKVKKDGFWDRVSKFRLTDNCKVDRVNNAMNNLGVHVSAFMNDYNMDYETSFRKLKKIRDLLLLDIFYSKDCGEDRFKVPMECFKLINGCLVLMKANR